MHGRLRAAAAFTISTAATAPAAVVEVAEPGLAEQALHLHSIQTVARNTQLQLAPLVNPDPPPPPPAPTRPPPRAQAPAGKMRMLKVSL